MGCLALWFMLLGAMALGAGTAIDVRAICTVNAKLFSGPHIDIYDIR